jgi:hypothetical protein
MTMFSSNRFLFVLGRKSKFVKKKNFMESKQTMENLAYYIFTLKTGKISTEKGMPRFSTTGFLFVLGRKRRGTYGSLRAFGRSP